MNAAKAEILLLAPDLLGESLALQLTSLDPDLIVCCRQEQLQGHPGLVIWSLETVASLHQLQLELHKLQEFWQPSPVLVLLPRALQISSPALLNLNCPGVLQDPDLPTLQEGITTLLKGGRVVRLNTEGAATNAPKPTMGLGQWLLSSGLQQISNDLQLIDALLIPPPDNLLLRLLLEGRQRELRSAQNLLLWLWGPLQVGLAHAEQLGCSSSYTANSARHDANGHSESVAITLRERNAIAVWASIQGRLTHAVEEGLSNGTGALLAIEGLQPERRRDLLLALLQQLDQVMARLRTAPAEGVQQLSMQDQWGSLQVDLRRQAIQAMTGSYVRLPRGEELHSVAQELMDRSDLNQSDEELPDARRMLEPLVLDRPVLVDGQLLPADHPKALLQLETLVSNWLVRNAELISAELLGICGDWPELRRYLLDERLVSTRELERLRNQLNNQLRWQLWVQRPIRLYESQRLLFQLNAGSIEPLTLIEPRDQELRSLGWWQQQVALLLEARDAIAPQVQTLVQRIGDLMVVVLTQVIGRAIGLVGRGVAQGMGRSVSRRPIGRS